MNELIVSLIQNKIDEYSYSVKSYLNLYEYNLNDNRFKRLAFNELKLRSQYKRVLKEYKKQCRQLEIQKYQKQIQYWRKQPDKFVEDILGVKLYWYQKAILKMMKNR